MDVFHDEHIEIVSELLRIEQKRYFLLTALCRWQWYSDRVSDFGINLCHASGIRRTVYGAPTARIVECEVR